LKKLAGKLPLVLIFLVAIAFSIKSMREPDLWWQIRTGEWILEHHQIPKQDVFSYTYEGTKWTNVKWGSEVLFALISKAAAPECVFLLQAVVSCLTLLLLLKIAQLKIVRTQLTIPVALIFSLVATEYRIIGRPEMFSHLFTVLFLFFLLKEKKEPSNQIYWLIPLQIVWANLHEAFGIGIVLTTIFVAGDWLEYFLVKRSLFSGKAAFPKKISTLLPVQIVSVIINPNGVELLTRPLNILGQVYENKYTTELFDFKQPEYWQWNVYWTIGLLVIGGAGALVYFKAQKARLNRFKLFVEQFGISYLLTIVAFVYLAATAYRNIIFLVLVFFPLFVFGMDALLSKISLLQKLTKQANAAFCVLLFLLYCLVVSNKYYELTNSRDRFGLEVLSTHNPTGAAEFIKQNNIRGKCFSDYLTSSHLLWKLQPEFKSFIDLRDLDIFPTSFFNRFAAAVTFPEEFDKLDSVQHFNYAVLFRPQYLSLHEHLYNSNKFKLVFADAVACVFVRKTSTVDSSITSFFPVKPVRHSSFGFIINKILNPFYALFNYATVDNDLQAAAYFSTVGKFDLAEAFAKKSAQNNIENYKGAEILGEVYYKRALFATNPEEKNKWLNAAGNAYVQSLTENDSYAQTHLGIGAVYFLQKNIPVALQSFERAIELDENNLSACNFAAECCKHFINQNQDVETYVKKAITFYRKADKLNPDNPTIILNLGFLYFRSGDCSNTKKYLSKVADFSGLSEEQRISAKDCLLKCGQ